MYRGFLILVISILFLKCEKSDDRCGIIIQKVEIQTTLYFVLQTDEYINYYNIKTGDVDVRGEALAWSIGRGARSGRVAWQYITDLAARTNTRLISKD